MKVKINVYVQINSLPKNRGKIRRKDERKVKRREEKRRKGEKGLDKERDEQK